MTHPPKLTKDRKVLAWFDSLKGVRTLDLIREGALTTLVETYDVVDYAGGSDPHVVIVPAGPVSGARRTRIIPIEGSSVDGADLIAPSGKTRWRRTR